MADKYRQAGQRLMKAHELYSKGEISYEEWGQEVAIFMEVTPPCQQ